MSHVTDGPEHPLQTLVHRIESTKGFPEILARFRKERDISITGTWGSSCALTASALAKSAPGPVLFVLSHLSDIDAFSEEIEVFSGFKPLAFTAQEGLRAESLLVDETFGQRIHTLKQLQSNFASLLPQKRDLDQPTSPAPWIVTSIQALMQPVPSPEQLVARSRFIEVGQTLDIDEWSTWLVDGGFKHVSSVELPGEFSVRGGIVDLYPLDFQNPIRFELFDDQLESLRFFDIESQRSVRSVSFVALTAFPSPVNPQDISTTSTETPDVSAIKVSDPSTHFCDFLPDNTWVCLIETSELEQQGRDFLDRVDDPRGLFHTQTVFSRVAHFPTIHFSSLPMASVSDPWNLKCESIDLLSGDFQQISQELEQVSMSYDVFLTCHNEAEKKRLTDIFSDSSMVNQGRLHLCLGHVNKGFRLVDSKIIVISDEELFRKSSVRRVKRPRHHGRPIDSFLELNKNDLVVHVTHGIARYRGLELLEKQDHAEEHLVLEFQGATKLFVPVSKINLVQKYVGGSNSRPALSKLGGSAWKRRKQRVQEALVDVAAEMIELQASRDSRPGINCPPDSEWQQAFDAAFPHTETADQLEADRQIKNDMQQSRPMDRLICGDVGYGKTELAMRAAFKAVDAGRQVAMLVPTTLLAEQHVQTFRERMAKYPIEIEVLSRFRSRKHQHEILDHMKKGTLDIVIGTHRLVQLDVSFQNLGLVIIDEEQRFGVEHKERLKALRTAVDVLTLTATPIPRTLHMAVLGIRDISNLETAPQDRIAIETRIIAFESDFIRHAILRELNRGGQVFFVHNRVESIWGVAEQLNRIVPEAIIRVAHGQMPEDELENAMRDFIHHRCDILVATTIIESGLDIPNANTIFINWADRYGLADLHQLRGRVGRYRNRAYCYLVLDPKRPVTPQATKRLKAIEEFSHLGAGFQIAMRDLEIRGAGNLLGHQQSGHISSVGYEMYCQLLEKAVRHLQGRPLENIADISVELPWPSYLPYDFIPNQRHKMDIYRRFSHLELVTDLHQLEEEIVDRFGPAPTPVNNLIASHELRLLAKFWQIESIHAETHQVILKYRNPTKIQLLAKHHRDITIRIVDQQCAYIPLAPQASASQKRSRKPTKQTKVVSPEIPSMKTPTDLLFEQLKSLLQPIG